MFLVLVTEKTQLTGRPAASGRPVNSLVGVEDGADHLKGGFNEADPGCRPCLKWSSLDNLCPLVNDQIPLTTLFSYTQSKPRTSKFQNTTWEVHLSGINVEVSRTAPSPVLGHASCQAPCQAKGHVNPPITLPYTTDFLCWGPDQKHSIARALCLV